MAVPLARRNLLHEKGKLLLSVLGVAASLTLIMLLFGFRNGMFSAVSAYIDHMNADLIVTQRGARGSFSYSSIPAAIHNTLAVSSDALEIEHALVADIIFTDGDVKMPAVLVGYNTQNGIGGPWTLRAGRAVQGPDELVLDAWLAQRTGIKLLDDIEVLGRRFEVVGLSGETSSWLGSYLFISRDAAEELLQLPGIASFYLLRLPQGADASAVGAALEAQVPGVETMTPLERATLSLKLLGAVLDTPINMILLIGVATGVAVTGLTVYSAVVDRMREYGVLKAVGAGASWLRRLVITETLYRAILGFLLGTALSYLTAELIMRLFPQFTIIVRLDTVLMTGGVTLAMTVLAALLPLRRVAVIDPAIAFNT